MIIQKQDNLFTLLKLLIEKKRSGTNGAQIVILSPMFGLSHFSWFATAAVWNIKIPIIKSRSSLEPIIASNLRGKSLAKIEIMHPEAVNVIFCFVLSLSSLCDQDCIWLAVVISICVALLYHGRHILETQKESSELFFRKTETVVFCESQSIFGF